MDCEWNEWGDWKRGKCRCINEPGKPGKKYRSRDRKIGEDFGGKPCLKLNKKPMPIGKIKPSLKIGTAKRHLMELPWPI